MNPIIVGTLTVILVAAAANLIKTPDQHWVADAKSRLCGMPDDRYIATVAEMYRRDRPYGASLAQYRLDVAREVGC
jgi:hypothetical protein